MSRIWYCCCAIMITSVWSFSVGAEPPRIDSARSWKEVIAPVLNGKVKHLQLKGKTFRTDQRTTLKDLRDIVIDGGGGTLLMSRQDHIFKIEDCRNVTIRNLTLDYDPLIFTQAKVTKVSPDGTEIEFEIEQGYPDLTPRLIARECIDVFAADGTFRHDTARVSGKPEIIDARHGRMLLTISSGKGVKVGDRIPIGRRFANVIQTVGCTNVTFENLNIYGSGCFAIGIRFSGGNDRIHRVRVVPGPRPAGATTDRLRSTNGDGFNISFSRNYPVITECEVCCNNDDAINYHAGEIMPLYDGSPDGLRFKTVRPYSSAHDRLQKVFGPGDKVLILKKDTYEIVGNATLKSIKPAAGAASFETLAKYFDRAAQHPQARKRYQPTAYDIEFESAPFKLENDMFFQLIPSGRPFLIADNYFHDHRGRGMRIMVPNGTISGNRLERIKHSGISLGPEYAYWNEAGWVENITVKDNTLNDIGYGALCLGNSPLGGAISTYAVLKDYRNAKGCHSNISIMNNRIRNCPGAGIFLFGTHNSKVDGNILTNTATSKQLPGTTFGFRDMKPVWLLFCRGISGENTINGKEEIIENAR